MCGSRAATMGCMRYVVTGGTGFIGGRVISRILDTQPDAQVWVLVRRPSLGRFERRSVHWGERVKPLVADLTELELTDETIAELGDDRPRGALRGDL